MNLELDYRRAKIDDVENIVNLLIDDKLGERRESISDDLREKYLQAFNTIDADHNQFLMVVTLNELVIATCHLTIIPSLTFQGSTRMQIEAVRVSSKYRGHNIGKSMIQNAIEYAKSKEAKIIQLTTNTQRVGVVDFYESLGFEKTHVGMKMFL